MKIRLKEPMLKIMNKRPVTNPPVVETLFSVGSIVSTMNPSIVLEPECNPCPSIIGLIV
jgi:hypothetical protein